MAWLIYLSGVILSFFIGRKFIMSIKEDSILEERYSFIDILTLIAISAMSYIAVLIGGVFLILRFIKKHEDEISEIIFKNKGDK